MFQAGADAITLAQALLDLKLEARANGLTDDILDAEFATWQAG